MTLRLMILGALVAIVCGCAARTREAVMAKPAIPRTETECKTRGGNWTALGLPYDDKPRSCDLKTTDAGHTCSDSRECQGSCMAPEGMADGARATGTCSAHMANFGDVGLVEHGRVERFNAE